MQTRTMLRDRLRQSRDWSTTIDELEKELEGSGSKPEQSERLFELAAIAEEVIPERDRALGLYQRAWKLHPDNLKALSRAREVYAEIGRLEMVGKLGEMELRSPAAAANLAAIVGEALLDSGQKDKALAVLQKALEKTPDSFRVKDALAALSYDAEFWTDEIERLTEDAGRFDSAMASRMLLRAARIMRLQEPDNAGLEGLLRQVLGHDIDEPSANFMLESLLTAAQRWTDLEAHHDARVKHASDVALKIERCRGFGLQWLQRFKDRERSARFFTQAIQLAAAEAAPARSSVAMFALLRQTEGERKDWQGLLAIADSLLARNTTGSDADEMTSERLYVSSAAGAIGFEQLGDEAIARKYYRIAAGIAPKNPGVAEFVDAFGLDSAGQPTVAETPQAAAVKDDSVAVAAQAAADKAAADKAAEAQAAADQAAADQASAAVAANVALAAEQAAAAASVASEQAAAADQAAADKAAADKAAADKAAADKAAADKAAEAQAAADKAAAEVAAAAKPVEAPRAARSTSAPKAEVPADLGAAMDAARNAEAGNDKGIGAWKDVIAKHPAQRGPRRELARILRGNQAWSQLADALRDEESKATTVATEKSELLRELAEVYGKLSNDNQVIASLTAALSHDASQLEVYDQLAAVYESKKRWPDLVKVLGEKAEQIADADGKVAIHLQIANLYLERFSNQAEAIKAFERVMELDPQNSTAIEHLLAVYEKRRDWEKLIKLKENEIAQTPASERAAKVIEVAKMAATKVKKPEICTHWWEMVVQYEPTHEEALAELYKLYERNKEWDKLADISSKQADSAADDKARADALQRLGILYMEKLEDSGKAIDAWQRLLAIDENHRRAQDALKKLYVTEGRWDDLEEFYRSRGKLDEYIRVLEREVEAGSEQHRLSLAMKIATLYRDELQKPDRAARAFEKVLTLDENNLVAAEALIPLYEASRDPKRLVGVLEIQLKSTQDLSTRQERIKRLAEYSEEKLKEKGAAFQWWLKAHAEDHHAEWIRTEAERLAGETGAWNQLVDAYTASLPKFDHKADALPLMLVMARVIEQEQGDVDRALEVNRQILAIDDANEQAVDALERLYLGKGRYQELLDIYQRKLDLTSDGDLRVAIQSKIGQLYEDEVKDDKKAIVAYQAILDAAGDVPAALTSLDRVYLRNQMWPQLADILSRQILANGPDDNRALHLETKYRLGQIRETQLNDAAGALDAYRDILDIEVNHEKARVALERRLATSTDDKHRLAVAGVLEPVYEQLGSWEALVGIHEIQLAAETDSLRKTSLLLRIGELQRGNLGNAEKAFDAHARCFAIDPSVDIAKVQIEDLAPHIENGWKRVNALFEAAIGKAVDPSLAHELCGKVARNYEEHLHDSGKAVEFFRKALSQEPEDLVALNALEKIFQRDAQYKDLLEVYRRRVDISNEPTERLKFLVGIAELQEQRLNAPQDAIAAYNEILGQEPDDLPALQALDRLYVGTKQWRDLGDNLSRQLLLVEADDARVTLLVRLAQLRETHLGEGGAAVETYRQVLDVDSSNSDAISALERMISIAEHELTIANILEPIYHARGDWQKQIGVYEIMAKHSYDPARKIELLHKIAELHEIGGDDTSNAFATQARALREDPRNDVTHGQIERLARSLGQWSQAAALYDSIASESSDDELKVALLTRRAQVQESELRDDKAAVASYERILQTAPQAVDAASAIQAIHERNSDWPALVAALRRKSEILVDVNDRKALLLRAAQIEEEVIGDNDAAIATYNQVLRIDENDGAAMNALERIYVRLSRWAPLKDIYAKKVELADDPADKKQMLYVLAQVYDRELGDVAKAIETYQGILDIDADELPAIQSLDRLYGQAERWYDLLGNLERQVELADSPGEHVALKYRIGHLWQTRLGDLARAVESYREALELDPAHAETLHALDGLLRGKNEPVMAAKVLEPIYDATGEYAKLIEVLEVMVTHTDDPLTRVELLHRIAVLNEQRLGAAEPAFDAYARALKDDASNNLTLGHIERLAALTNRWPVLAKLYAAEAEKSLDVPRQVDLLARLARISEQEINDVPASIGTYRRILDVEFDNKPAVLALDRLYTQSQAWPELTEILRREIQLAEDDAEVATLQYRLGSTLEHRQGDRKGAVEVYREIISANPTHVETIEALEQMFHGGHHQAQIGAILEPLYEAANENEKLHGLFQVQLGLLQGTERQSMFQRLAELAEHRLFDAGRASAWWGQAYIEDPRWEAAGEHIERLAKDTGGWDELVGVYTQALARNADVELQRQSLLRLARVYEFEQRDVAKAVETHLRVLEVAPTDADALASLDRLYLGAGMYDDLVEILRRRVEITSDHDENLELLFRRGAVFADALGDSQAALDCYNAVLEKESRNRRALECVEALQFHRQEWAALRETYEKLVDVSEGDDELAGIYSRMAHLDSEALGLDDRSVELWGRVLDIRAEDQTALSALAGIHTRREQWESLIEIIERQVAVASSERDQVALYKHMGMVWADKLGRERNAIDAWTAADRVNPNDLETLRALAHLYRSTQSWDELSQTLRRILELGAVTGQVTEDESIELYAQLGQLEGDILGRVDDAVSAWRHVVAIDPADFRALAALETLFTREGRWEEAIEVMEKRALVLDDEGQRRDTLLQAAATWEEKVESPSNAALVYERVRQADPANVVASDRLEAIYREGHRWQELVEVLLERADLRTDTQEQIRTLNEVAHIYETELNDQESAFVVLQAAFKRDYANEQTAVQLERLATATNRWQELLDEYTNRVNELEREDRTGAADLWVKIGRWYGEHLSHLEWAIHSVQQALRLDPAHTNALTALAELQRKRGSWHELIETLQKHAGLEPSAQRKAGLYTQLAELLEMQVQDIPGAVNAYQQALVYDAKARASADATDEAKKPSAKAALVALDRLYRRTEQWEPLIDVLGKRAEQEPEERESLRYRLEVGQIWDLRIYDSGRAISAYQGVLDVDPGNQQALRALESLYEKTNQSEKYLEVLEAQLDTSPSDAERVALYERMAAAWEERFGKLDRAAECLEKIVAVDGRNFAAYRELARLYAQAGKSEALVETYRNHILATTDNQTRVDLYCAMGAVYETQLNDLDRSIESYTDVLTFSSEEPRALDALGRLYEKIAEWDRAIESMAQLVRITEEPRKQVDLFWRMGRIQYNQLHDAETSEANFLRGLTIDPAHVATMEALVKQYSDRGDWLKSAQMMVRAESYTPVTTDKVRLLNEAGHIYQDKLHAPEQAKQLYAAVISLDPEYVDAGRPLAELYFANKEWHALSPVIDMLVRKVAQLHPDPRELNELFYRAAKTADEIGESQKALNYYKSAYDIDSTHLPTLTGRADLLFKMQDWDNAGKIYQTILVQHRDNQSEADVVRIYNRLGMVRQALGERKKALNMFEKALEIDPTHRETLLAVIDLQQAANDWEAVVHAKRSLIASSQPKDKIQLLDEVGAIYRDKLANPQKATAAYVEALEFTPDDHQLLQKLLDLYTETKQWRKVVETIERFVALESDPLRKAAYLQAAATICRDELKSLDEAVDFYNFALDAFFSSDRMSDQLVPRALKAFESIDKIMTTKKDWKGQERAYRDMVKRLPQNDNPVLHKVRVSLLDGLGEIYRSRLKNYQTATEVFQFAQQLDPKNELRADGTDRAEILAELYLVAGPDYADKAVEQHMRMLRNEPFKYDSYKALRRIYMDAHQYDKTWCLCNTLAFLKKADEEELRFYEQYKPRGFTRAKASLTPDGWAKLVHPDENRYISAIFGTVWQAVAMMKSYPHKDAGIKRKDRLALPGELMFSKLFYYASQVLNVPPPEVFLVADNKPADIQLGNFSEKDQLIPSFVVRPHLLQGKSEREVAFLSARRLTYLRPEYYLKLLLPTNTELKIAMLSAIALVNPRFPVPPDSVQLVQQYMPEMQKRIPPHVLEQLAVVVNRFIQAAPEINLAAWGHAVDAVSHRTGFLICGDLEVAARMVSAEPVMVGGPQVKDKIKELVLYSISEEYFAVRAMMSLTIAG